MRTAKIAATFAAVALLAACGANDAKGEGAGTDKGAVASKSGPDGSRTFAATGFTGVELAGSDNVVVTRGDAFSVVATGPQEVLDKLEVTVKNGVLVVSRKSNMMNWNSDKGATIAVTLPLLDSAELSGSGEMTVDTASGDSVDVVLSGSGNLDVASVTAKTLAVALAGSGDLTIRGGKADSGDVAVAGSGDVDVKGVTLASADISVAGSGDVDATATSTAEVSIVGSGDVRVGGGAKCDSSELGSGTVSCS
jgi:Putative auto-transporter adhesin, head GIN domain